MPYADADVRRDYHRRYNAEHYARKKESDPDFMETMRQRTRARRAKDPNAGKAKDPDYHRKYMRRWRQDPVRRKRENDRKAERAREKYATDPDYRERMKAIARGRPVRLRKHLPVLIARQGGLCGLCGEPLGEITPKIHVDHVVPRSFGGNDELDNLQAAHRRCNIAKGNRRMF